MLETIDEAVSAIGEANHSDEVAGLTVAACKHLGLSRFVFYLNTNADEKSIRTQIIASNLPDHLSSDAELSQSKVQSLLFPRSGCATPPVLISEEQLKTLGLSEAANKFDFSQFVRLGVHSEDGRTGNLCVMGRRHPLAQWEIMRLQYFGLLAFAKLVDFRQDSKPKHRLSQREVECLAWIGEGKTSFETGRILGLSEFTVNNYVASANRKLGAVNRTQALLIAARMGII